MIFLVSWAAGDPVTEFQAWQSLAVADPSTADLCSDFAHMIVLNGPQSFADSIRAEVHMSQLDPRPVCNKDIVGIFLDRFGTSGRLSPDFQSIMTSPASLLNALIPDMNPTEIANANTAATIWLNGVIPPTEVHLGTDMSNAVVRWLKPEVDNMWSLCASDNLEGYCQGIHLSLQRNTVQAALVLSEAPSSPERVRAVDPDGSAESRFPGYHSRVAKFFAKNMGFSEIFTMLSTFKKSRTLEIFSGFPDSWILAFFASFVDPPICDAIDRDPEATRQDLISHKKDAIEGLSCVLNVRPGFEAVRGTIHDTLLKGHVTAELIEDEKFMTRNLQQLSTSARLAVLEKSKLLAKPGVRLKDAIPWFLIYDSSNSDIWEKFNFFKSDMTHVSHYVLQRELISAKIIDCLENSAMCDAARAAINASRLSGPALLLWNDSVVSELVVHVLELDITFAKFVAKLRATGTSELYYAIYDRIIGQPDRQCVDVLKSIIIEKSAEPLEFNPIIEYLDGLDLNQRLVIPRVTDRVFTQESRLSILSDILIFGRLSYEMLYQYRFVAGGSLSELLERAENVLLTPEEKDCLAPLATVSCDLLIQRATNTPVLALALSPYTEFRQEFLSRLKCTAAEADKARTAISLFRDETDPYSILAINTVLGMNVVWCKFTYAFFEILKYLRGLPGAKWRNFMALMRTQTGDISANWGFIAQELMANGESNIYLLNALETSEPDPQKLLADIIIPKIRRTIPEYEKCVDSPNASIDENCAQARQSEKSSIQVTALLMCPFENVANCASALGLATETDIKSHLRIVTSFGFPQQLHPIVLLRSLLLSEAGLGVPDLRKVMADLTDDSTRYFFKATGSLFPYSRASFLSKYPEFMTIQRADQLHRWAVLLAEGTSSSLMYLYTQCMDESRRLAGEGIIETDDPVLTILESAKLHSDEIKPVSIFSMLFKGGQSPFDHKQMMVIYELTLLRMAPGWVEVDPREDAKRAVANMNEFLSSSDNVSNAVLLDFLGSSRIERRFHIYNSNAYMLVGASDAKQAIERFLLQGLLPTDPELVNRFINEAHIDLNTLLTDDPEAGGESMIANARVCRDDGAARSSCHHVRTAIADKPIWGLYLLKHAYHNYIQNGFSSDIFVKLFGFEDGYASKIIANVEAIRAWDLPNPPMSFMKHYDLPRMLKQLVFRERKLLKSNRDKVAARPEIFRDFIEQGEIQYT